MKKLQYTTNDPASSTDYLAGDNTWKTIPGGGGGVPYTGATADVDLGTHSLTADTIGIGTTAGSEKLHIDGGATTTRVKIDADNGVSRILSFRTDDSQRWALRVDGTESGSNSGADFQIRRYNDAGTFVDAPIAINRATGNITTSQNINGATPTEMSYLSGVTSAIQTQINSKISTSKSFMGSLWASLTAAAGATVYGSFTFPTSLGGETARIFVVPNDCTMSKFYVRMFSAQPASGSLTFTLRKNLADTSVVVTIAAGSVAGTEANSGSTSATYLAGDDCSIKVVNSSASTSGQIHNVSIMIEI